MNLFLFRSLPSKCDLFATKQVICFKLRTFLRIQQYMPSLFVLDLGLSTLVSLVILWEPASLHLQSDVGYSICGDSLRILFCRQVQNKLCSSGFTGLINACTFLIPCRVESPFPTGCLKITLFVILHR